MKKIFLIFGVILLITGCLEPTHDNAYDPENPNKAELVGTVYHFDGAPLRAAQLLVVQDTVVDGTQSDNEGNYEFLEVNPGIYDLEVKAPFYIPETLEVDLPADTHNVTDIYMSQVFYDFEGFEPGSEEIDGLEVRRGDWFIDKTLDQEMVYCGNHDPGTAPNAISYLKRPVTDFWMCARMIIPGIGIQRASGFVFRAQDERNYYLMIFNHSGALLGIVRNDTLKDTLAVSPVGYTTDRWYDVNIDCCDEHIEIWLDYDLLFSLADNTFLDGRVGFWVFSMNPTEPARVFFDDFYVDTRTE